MDGAGFGPGINRMAGRVGDVETAVEIDGDAAGGDKARGDGATQSGGVDLNHVVGRYCLGDEEIVEAVDVDRRRGVEGGDVAGIDSSICAESRDGAVSGIGDEEVAGRVDCQGGRSEQASALRNYALTCAAASGK